MNRARRVFTMMAAVALFSCGSAPRPRARLAITEGSRYSPHDDALFAQPPEPLPSRDHPLPPTQVFTLANGLTVYLAPRPTQHVSVFLVCRSCAENDVSVPAGLPELAMRSLARAMRSGNRRASGFILGGQSSTLAGVLGATVPAADLEAMIRLLARAPASVGSAHTGSDVERRLMRTERSHNALALLVEVLSTSVFGPAHPLGRRFQEVSSNIDNIPLQDIDVYLRTHFVPASSALVISGPVSREQLEPLANEVFGGWGGAPVRDPVLPRLRPLRPRVFFVDLGHRALSIVIAALPGVSRTDPDYAAMRLIEYVLSGSFGSRLNLSLREQLGLAYTSLGASESFEDAGLMLFETRVESSVAVTTLEQLMEQIHRIRRERISEAELETAKRGWHAALHAQLSRAEGAADAASAMFVFRLDPDAYARLDAAVSALTVEDVYRVAQRRLAPSAANLVISGDRNEIGAQVERTFGFTEYIGEDD